MSDQQIIQMQALEIFRLTLLNGILENEHEKLKAERERLQNALKCAEHYRDQNEEAASVLASATDLINTWARQDGVTEAARPEDIKMAINALWNHYSRMSIVREVMEEG